MYNNVEDPGREDFKFDEVFGCFPSPFEQLLLDTQITIIILKIKIIIFIKRLLPMDTSFVFLHLLSF